MKELNFHLEDNDFPFHFEKVVLDEPYLWTLFKRSLLIIVGLFILTYPVYFLGYVQGRKVIKIVTPPVQSMDCHEDQMAYYNKVLLKQCYTELKQLKTPPKQAEVKKIVLQGLASYYSRAGCLGCSENFTMANGEPLDDSKITVAYNHAPMNSYITVTNLDNGKSISAKVTDRGGFENISVPKIVDLSVATKEALECASTCKVSIIK
jgi:rare lipoprotein A (peptidoglycan hydrolase)